MAMESLWDGKWPKEIMGPDFQNYNYFHCMDVLEFLKKQNQ